MVLPSPENGNGEGLDDLLSSDVRERILSVRQSLRELSAMLARDPVNGHGQDRPADAPSNAKKHG